MNLANNTPVDLVDRILLIFLLRVLIDISEEGLLLANPYRSAVTDEVNSKLTRVIESLDADPAMDPLWNDLKVALAALGALSRVTFDNCPIDVAATIREYDLVQRRLGGDAA